MPTYDYRCNTCGKEFEYFQSMTQEPLIHCLCEEKGDVQRLISRGSGIIFKGSGFYVTDYKKPEASKEPAPTGNTTNTNSSASTNSDS